jgi:type I restriction enzyme S subunit
MAGDSKNVARAHLADAGVEELPDDWDIVTLGELFTEDRGIAVGVMYPGDHDPDGVPLIKAGDLSGSIINPHPDFRISKDKHQEYRRTALDGGELIMTLVGNVGQCAVVPPRMAGWNAARAVAVMRLKEPSDTHFVQQCLLSHPLQHLMDVWCNTTVQATLNLKEIRQLPLPWPPKKCRDAIAEFGKALDDKIELNRRMNATLEAMARSLFQSWFVDFDPVRAKLDGRQPFGLDPGIAALFSASFHESQLGHIPTDWDVIPLYDMAQWVNGAAFKNEDFCAAGEGLPVIKIAELKDGISAQTKWSQREASADRIIDKGDLVYSWSGSPDTSLEAFLWSGGRGLLNQHIFKVISPSATEKRFVYYLLQYLRPVLVETARNKQTTGLGHVTIADMKRLLVCMPSKAVLVAFDRIIAPIFDRAFTNTLESRTLVTLRDTLLPRLLSGELSIETPQN